MPTRAVRLPDHRGRHFDLRALRRPAAAPAPNRPVRVSFWLAAQVNEAPFLAFYVLLGSTALAIGQGDVDNPVGWIALALSVLATIGLAVLVRRALEAGPVVDDALAAAGLAPRPQRRLPLARILLAPFPLRRRGVELVRNIRYGAKERGNLLDLYRHHSRPTGAPMLIHLHGGAFVMGSKSREARPLMFRFASQGWVCISANYRLRGARFADQLIDVKKVLSWVREHGPYYGADPNVVLVAGSSAGGHLASLAGLTQNDPMFQPGFEDADTSVTAVVSFYGYYGPVGAEPTSSPLAHDATDAPPFFVAHGDWTRSWSSTTRAASSRSSGASRRNRLSTWSFRARSTFSISSIRFASRRSSRGSRLSLPRLPRGTRSRRGANQPVEGVSPVAATANRSQSPGTPLS